MAFIYGGSYRPFSAFKYRNQFEESDSDSDDAMRDVDTPRKIPLPSRRSPLAERARYIPLRLTHAERKKLRIVEGSLQVSEYTDNVDILTRPEKKQAIIRDQLRDICGILSGLMVASDYREGQRLIADRDFSMNASFFQDIFEVARRFKITNPEKMRAEYGKLVYMLQDASIPQIQDLLGFNIVSPVKTVYDYLKERNGLDLLSDPEIEFATQEVLQDGTQSRAEIAATIRKKERTVTSLCAKFASPELSKEEIHFLIHSVTDNNSFLNSNAKPIHKMIYYLKTYFDPDMPDTEFSLAISAGREGARLTHTHKNQYYYALQSLELWAEIMENMFMLWSLGEADLLDGRHPYRLCNTGQGLNRVQQSPQCYRAVSAIVSAVQVRLGNWIGSSVVHMGDHNVPNALMFIDKYTQVPRILVPIVKAIESIDELMAKYGAKHYIESVWGDAEVCKKTILTDFFRHAFDGSGADNFFDAGSCIDGRLTSAWNWCSRIEKKKYYPVFLLSGFVGFDGDFQK